MRKQLILWASVIALTLLILVDIYFFFPSVAASPLLSLKKPEPVYNPAALSWTLATSTPPWEARDSHTPYVFNGKLWFFGGLDGNGFYDCSSGKCITRYWDAPHFNDSWSSPDGVNWTRETEHTAFPPRRSASVVEFHGKLWMFGGFSPLGGLQSDVWSSVDGVNWILEKERAAFVPREGQSAEVWKDKIWIVGGVNYDLRGERNDVWSSDNGVDWTLVTEHASWSPRWDHDTEIFNGRMYLASGMNLSWATFNDVWVTDDGAHWTQVVEHAPWAPRQGGSLMAHNGLLWIISRLNDRDDEHGPNDVWYSADGANWQKTNTDPAWVGREDVAVLQLHNRIYVFGGMGAVGDHVEWQNDVWVSTE